MKHYPIFVDLNNQPCLVVGGGEVALRKIRLMRSAGAHITVIAPELCANLESELNSKFSSEFSDNIIHVRREFSHEDIGDYRLITAATNNPKVNQTISKLAQAANIPVNVVDQPSLCSFITPSIVDRSPVMIAISTGGGSPVLSRMLRSKIEATIPASYGRLASTLQRYRTKIKAALPDEIQRRRFWENVVQGSIAEQFFSGQEKDGEQALLTQLEQHKQNHKTDQQTDNENIGEVWLIGAGPGDPDLLTFRALRLMQQADVVLYDRLVSKPILDMTRRDAERIYVGKKRADHALPQNQISQYLVDLAKQGKRVVRLKGGDPFIFGRGGEEIELLAQSRIPFQIVPGITAASGCATYGGIPLTHRDHAQSCLFVTGHLKDNTVNLDWQQLATPNQTVVIYMGLVGLPVICQKLIEQGVSKNMPIALIEQGTTQQQRVFTGTLATMVDLIAEENIQAPTLTIIGSVVQLREKLAWFNK